MLIMLLCLQVMVGVVCWMYGDEEVREPGEEAEAD